MDRWTCLLPSPRQDSLPNRENQPFAEQIRLAIPLAIASPASAVSAARIRKLSPSCPWTHQAVHTPAKTRPFRSRDGANYPPALGLVDMLEHLTRHRGRNHVIGKLAEERVEPFPSKFDCAG